ncbi:ABATE domain-containing protein, partial [Actinacidiphila alni]|uniref:ABATE domain-containing protein n=1 Tax=Actinacidiphila alni TaxID=380248 RepID=UPI0033D68959
MEQPGERSPAPGPLRLVQDLVNTVDLEGGTEELGTPQALAAWAGERGVQGPGFDAGGLADVLVLREALRDVCQAHTGVDVPAGTLEALAALLERAPLRLAVDAAALSAELRDKGAASVVVDGENVALAPDEV